MNLDEYPTKTVRHTSNTDEYLPPVKPRGSIPWIGNGIVYSIIFLLLFLSSLKVIHLDMLALFFSLAVCYFLQEIPAFLFRVKIRASGGFFYRYFINEPLVVSENPKQELGIPKYILYITGYLVATIASGTIAVMYVWHLISPISWMN